MTPIGLDPPPDMECSYWPDGWPQWLGGTSDEWLGCCQIHDQAAMTVDSAVALGACVAKVSPVMGLVMMIGVAVLGPAYLAIRRRQNRR